MTVSINGTSGLTFNDASTQNTAASGFGFKNRIINGAMTIDQRNAGASVTPASNQYTLDRWNTYQNVSSKFSIQQDAGAVTPPAGFNDYLGVTSLSAYSVLSNGLNTIMQYVEGFNCADFAWGTANASTVTLSFWVRSSLTGTFGGAITNADQNRSYPFSYTISAANTWEQKSVTIAGDTSGTWNKTNGNGLSLFFGLGVGSTYSGTAGSWAGAAYFSATGATSVVGTSGATFYITGVQLEKGSTATSFDYRPYGTELALCQRYYGRFQSTGIVTSASFGTGIANSTSQGAITIQFPQTMRSSPTILQSQTAITDSSTYDSNVSAIAAQYTCTTNARLVLNTAGGMTQYRTGLLIAQSSTSGYVDFSAEL